jgi:hypothetical protein
MMRAKRTRLISRRVGSNADIEDDANGDDDGEEDLAREWMAMVRV